MASAFLAVEPLAAGMRHVPVAALGRVESQDTPLVKQEKRHSSRTMLRLHMLVTD